MQCNHRVGVSLTEYSRLHEHQPVVCAVPNSSPTSSGKTQTQLFADGRKYEIDWPLKYDWIGAHRFIFTFQFPFISELLRMFL